MMADQDGNKILKEWRVLADRAGLPTDAPRPPRTGYPLGIGVTALVLVVVVAAVATRGMNLNGLTARDAGSTASLAPPASIPAATPSSTGAATATPVPVSAGACSASQFVLGQPTSEFGFSALGTKSVYVTQPMRNDRGACVLDLPGTIGVAPATGQFKTVNVANGGTASSFTIAAGQSFSIVIGAWWSVPAMGLTARPCSGPVEDVTRVQIPLSADNIRVELGTVWHEVCASPTTVSITVEN
jgi:hypothetical protein